MPLLGGEATKRNFMAAGREDADVRSESASAAGRGTGIASRHARCSPPLHLAAVMGAGRPFLLEVFNPPVTRLSAEALAAAQRAINTHPLRLMGVRDLQVVPASQSNIIKEAAEIKRKTYR